MVNRLSDLAQFLQSDSIPLWLREELHAKQEEISLAFDQEQPVTLTGPNGESVTLTPKKLVQ
jgi:hypothetical protein